MTINEAEHEAPEVVEQPKEEAPIDKLSNREALQRAISEQSEEKEAPKTAAPAPVEPQPKEAPVEVEAPSEFSAAGKKAWQEKDIAGIQREYRRIHDLRTQEITRAQQAERAAREEGKTYREMAKMAAPYIEARGAEGVSPEKAIMEALALVNEFRKADPSTVKSELKKLGIDLDAAPGAASRVDDSKLSAVQERLDRLEKERQDQILGQTTQMFAQSISKLASLKTRTGDPVFPGFHDQSEAGIQFAKELGSLTMDERFRAGVLRRFPEATHEILVREAYKYLGGPVSGESVTVSTNKPNIEKSRRAAASTPGGVVKRGDSSSLVGKLSNRAALMKALEEQREH